MSTVPNYLVDMKVKSRGKAKEWRQIMRVVKGSCVRLEALLNVDVAI